MFKLVAFAITLFIGFQFNPVKQEIHIYFTPSDNLKFSDHYQDVVFHLIWDSAINSYTNTLISTLSTIQSKWGGININIIDIDAIGDLIESKIVHLPVSTIKDQSGKQHFHYGSIIKFSELLRCQK